MIADVEAMRTHNRVTTVLGILTGLNVLTELWLEVVSPTPLHPASKEKCLVFVEANVGIEYDRLSFAKCSQEVTGGSGGQRICHLLSMSSPRACNFYGHYAKRD